MVSFDFIMVHLVVGIGMFDILVLGLVGSIGYYVIAIDFESARADHCYVD